MANNDGFNKQQIQQLRSLFDESENRLTRKHQDYTDQSLMKMKTEIISGVADILDNVLMPRLDDHEQRITKLETVSA